MQHLRIMTKMDIATEMELILANGVSPEAGQVLGCVSEPTIYYTTEGSNVYFQLKKDGKAVDPKEYLPQMAMDTLD